MYGPLTIPIIVLLALATGAALGQFWRVRWLGIRLQRHARRILADAERTGQARVLDAELKAKQILLDENKQSKRDLELQRKMISDREEALEAKLAQLEEKSRSLSEHELQVHTQAQELRALQNALESEKGEYAEKLAKLSGLSAAAAQELLLATEKQKVAAALQAQSVASIQEAAENVEKEARQLLVSSLERLAPQIAHEKCVTLLPLKDDDMKSRIIGRDGRNVRAFESLTGVDVLLEEIPGQIMLSCHQPQRREIARRALELLMLDGRIQPSRIAQVVEQVTKELEEQAIITGQEAATAAGVSGLDREVLQQIGKLKFRTSASQNVLEHLVECASLARLMGAELGLPESERQAFVRAAFLHDIGKAAIENSGLSHALAGAELLKAHGESVAVVNAVAAHHKEVSDGSILAPLVRTVDALSGARPGARREDLQATLRRMTDMEKIALEFKGVAQAYVYQAGRELHVSVRAEEVGDNDAVALAHQIASALQQKLRAGAPVRISVVREVRAQGVANWGTADSPQS